MSRTVDVLAPAPIRHVPARTRLARTSYAPVVEPVELRELSLSDAPRGPDISVANGRHLVTRLVENAVWRPIGSLDPFAENKAAPRDPVGPTGDEFVAWLGGHGEAGASPWSDLDRCLEGTPLLARLPGERHPFRPLWPWNVAKQGSLSLDTREGTPRRVSEYMAGNVALIEDKPYMRMPGLLVPLNAPHRADSPGPLRIVRHPGGWTTNSSINFGNLYGIHRIGDLVHEGLLHQSDFNPVWCKADFDGVAIREDEDLELMLRESVRVISASTPKAGYALPRDMCETLEAYAALGSVGAVPPRDLPDAWQFVSEFVNTLLARDENGWISHGGPRIAFYADRIAIPRLLARDNVSEEDLDSLIGLGGP